MSRHSEDPPPEGLAATKYNTMNIWYQRMRSHVPYLTYDTDYWVMQDCAYSWKYSRYMVNKNIFNVNIVLHSGVTVDCDQHAR